MKERLLSLIFAIVALFSVLCPVVHADDSTSFSTCTHDWVKPIVHGYSISIPNSDVSFGVEFEQCSKCHWYKHDASLFIVNATYYSPFAPDVNGIVPKELITYWCNKYYEVFGKNATAKKYETGGGSAGSSGVGRRPSGYVDDKGTPTYNVSGKLQIVVEPLGLSSMPDSRFSTSVPQSLVAGRSSSGNSWTSSYIELVYYFEAPVSGLYYIGSSGNPYDFGTFNWFSGGRWERLDFVCNFDSASVWSKTISKGEKYYFYTYWLKRDAYQKPFKYSLNNIPVFVEPLGDSSITTTNNITINNNTWNGNIYQDNSTNLTYIYPQYTTINENNETVTNISNNPIIYNNETKQYYTYDTVTNNYYYITYETPTPSPSPDPGTDPTPTPEPGEDTGDASGIMKILQEIKAVLVSGFAGITEKLQNIGVGGSTPETAKPGSSSGNKGQSWWEKLLGKIGDAIVDGLLGAISAVLKLIFKLFTTILGWIIWLVSQVLTLFPFLPPGLGALLIGGVVVCFIIGLIKFIRG